MPTIKTTKTTKETIKAHVEVLMDHVSDAALGGGCRDPSKCMEKIAIWAALEDIFGVGNIIKVKIDGAQIKATIKTKEGTFRWFGLTPKSPKNNLIKFDAWTTKLLRHPDTPCPIQPHAYTIKLEKGSKVVPNDPKRRKAINAARAQRKAAGVPDKKYTRLTTHDRVLGLASI